MVERLVKAALDGMTPVSIHATGAEMVLATCTLCLRSIQAAIEVGANVAKLRQAIELILLACVDPKDKVQ